ALESDSDAQALGIAQYAGMRKLLVDDSKLPSDMKLTSPQLSVRSFDKAHRGIATYQNEDVFVEYLPYQPDKDGFLPSVLRRRFSEIACLLNQQKDAEFRAMHCIGYIDVSFPKTEFQLVFAIPPNHETTP